MCVKPSAAHFHGLELPWPPEPSSNTGAAAGCAIPPLPKLFVGGQVLLLDMGEPVKITDLARDLIRSAGRNVVAIGILFSVLRPREKLSDELQADADRTMPKSISRPRIPRLDAMHAGLTRLLALATEQSLDAKVNIREERFMWPSATTLSLEPVMIARSTCQ